MPTDAWYQIRVRGHLDANWSEWFARMTIARERDGTTTLTGALVDQAALFGVLTRVRNLGLPLISVHTVNKLSEEKMDESKTYTVKEAQLHFAKSVNGQVWELLGKPNRTPAENETLLYAAYTSCYHWLHVGTGVNHQRGEWLIARVYTALGIADAAMRHATRCLELTHAFPALMKDFDWAFAYEGMARANDLAGNQAAAREYRHRAEQSGHAIQDEEDKKIFFADFHGGNWRGVTGARMELGAFSISLTVKDIHTSKTFYEKLGFVFFAGEVSQNWVILKNGDHVIGLFQGMFEKNMLTFNPGWDQDAQKLDRFTDVRELQKQLKAQGVEFVSEADVNTTGPASFMLMDPDGNPILVDQHV